MREYLIWALTILPCALFAQEVFTHRTYDQVIFPATWHWASVRENAYTTISSFSIEEQLAEGARAFMFSVYEKDNEAVISTKNHLESRFEKLEHTLKILNLFIEQNSQEIITLVVDNQVSSDLFQLAFENTGILKRLYIHPPATAWPTIGQMINNEHNVVLFVKEYPSSAPTWMHDWRLYGRELFNKADEVDQLAQKEPRSFLLYHFEAKTQFEQGNNPTVQANSKFLEDVINIWSRTGKIPNFIAIQPFPDIYNCQELNRLLHISGEIDMQGKGQRDIYWSNQISALSSENFNFPTHLGDDRHISPAKPGFKFIPSIVHIENQSKDTTIYFEAQSMELSEGIKGYYGFEKGLADMSGEELNGSTFAGSPLFEYDQKRGNVLKLNGQSAVEIAKAEDYLLNAHAFTVSIWLKVTEFEGDNEGILSTLRRNYREGLHLILRNQKPYLGFHTNDTQGNTGIDTNQWYHIVWRYRADVEEQAIFVNGKADAISRGHPAFKGKGNLILGMRKNAGLELDFFNGYVDDLIIWDRALGNHEIIALSQGELPEIDAKLKQWYLVFLGVLISCCIGFYAAFKRKLKEDLSVSSTLSIKSEEQANETVGTVSPREDHHPTNPSIYFFGKFRIINVDGQDISTHLSPKIHRIFLYIILHQFRYNKGVSSGELERAFWKNLEEEKAANNRRVSIRKLRAAFETIPEIKIESKGTRWVVELDDRVYCDLWVLIEWLEVYGKRPDISINEFLIFQQFFHKPYFLEGVSAAELDEFHAWMEHQILDVCEKLLKLQNLTLENRLWVFDLIIAYDPLHEEAIKGKISYLLSQNQVNTAKYIYKDFSQLYQKTYDEAPPAMQFFSE